MRVVKINTSLKLQRRHKTCSANFDIVIIGIGIDWAADTPSAQSISIKIGYLEKMWPIERLFQDHRLKPGLNLYVVSQWQLMFNFQRMFSATNPKLNLEFVRLKASGNPRSTLD
ncbi:hypothetical protein ACLKA7_009363 [Drosophila subpalustris]